MGVKKTESFFRFIAKTFSTILIVAVVSLSVLLVGVRLIGFTPYTVLSGSMEPTYHVGSVIYVTDVDPTELKDNDPVTYKMANGTVVTHRIIEVINEGSLSELAFKTQGDANEVSDGQIPAAAVIGKPVFTVPYLGYVSDFIKKPQGLFIVVCVCILAIIVSILTEILFPKPQRKNTESKKDTLPQQQSK